MSPQLQGIRIKSEAIGRVLTPADIRELRDDELQELRLELNGVIESLDHQETKHTAIAAQGGPPVDPNWTRRVGVKRRVSRLALMYVDQIMGDRERQRLAAGERQLAQVLLRHGLPTDPTQLDQHLERRNAPLRPRPLPLPIAHRGLAS